LFDFILNADFAPPNKPAAAPAQSTPPAATQRKG